MKYLIGCLALVGLVAILAVGGCLGLIGYGFTALPRIPDYATRIAIEKAYATDLKAIDQGIRSRTIAALDKELSRDIVAIYTADTEVLKRMTITTDSYHTANGIGVGTLRSNSATVPCIVYEMTDRDATYRIFIVDHRSPGGVAPSPAH